MIKKKTVCTSTPDLIREGLAGQFSVAWGEKKKSKPHSKKGGLADEDEKYDNIRCENI